MGGSAVVLCKAKQRKGVGCTDKRRVGSSGSGLVRGPMSRVA